MGSEFIRREAFIFLIPVGNIFIPTIEKIGLNVQKPMNLLN